MEGRGKLGQHRPTRFTAADLAGWPAERLLAELGEPSSRNPGTTWRAADGGLVNLAPGGELETEEEWYAPWSERIPLGTPFEVWTFDRVLPPGRQGDDPSGILPCDDSECWQAYLVREASGELRVVEVQSLPTDEIL